MMKPMHHGSPLVTVLSVTFALGLCSQATPPAAADPVPATARPLAGAATVGAALAPPPVTLSPEQASVLQDALRAISEQSHIAIVAEDAPLHPRLLGKAPTLLPNAPAAAVLGKVADAYDYDVSQVGPVFVLKKRYTDPRDLPAVTLDKCIQSLNEVGQALDAINPTSAGDSSVTTALEMRGLAASFSPAQLQAMQAKTAAAGRLSPR